MTALAKNSDIPKKEIHSKSILKILNPYLYLLPGFYCDGSHHVLSDVISGLDVIHRLRLDEPAL